MITILGTAKELLLLPVFAVADNSNQANIQWLQAFILGIVQGITEFLPISSTAHLLIFTKVFGWKELGAKDFVDAIQFGSVVAILLYFRSLIGSIIQGAVEGFKDKDWQREEWKIVIGIAVGTIPALVLGFLLKDILPESALIIGTMSVVMAILLGLAEKNWRSQTGI